jgi:zinc transport system substrate-binding protein
MERRFFPATAVARRLGDIGFPTVNKPSAFRSVFHSYCAATLLLLAGCGAPPAERPGDGRLAVFAGIPPVAYLAEQIGGTRVAVDVLVQPGQDPHTFEPAPRQVLALSRAKVFFKIGLPFEDVVLAKVQEGNPRMTVVDVAERVEKRLTGGHGHDHHGQGGVPDPHVWLSPPLLKIQAENVAAGLSAADPAHAEEYRRNLAGLLARIDAAHRRIGRMLAPYRGRSFLVFHPAFGYFADAYGLKEEPVEAGGSVPAPKQLRALIEKAKAEGIKTVFVQPQYDPHSAQVVAEAIGGEVVPMDGLAKDVLQDLEDIAEKIKTAFGVNSPRRHGEHGGRNDQKGLTQRRQGAKNGLKGRGSNQFAFAPSHFPSFPPSLSCSPILFPCALAPLREPRFSLRVLRVSVVFIPLAFVFRE